MQEFYHYFRPKAPTKINSYSTPRTCGHWRAVVWSVSTPGGEAGYLCRNCYAHLRSIEHRAIVRREFTKLFRNSWPLGLRPGAAVASRMEVAQ